MQIPVRSNLPFNGYIRHDREPSNIYHSLDNLHIATLDPTSPPLSNMKNEKQYQWRISKRELDVQSKILPFRPTDTPYITRPKEVLPPAIPRRPAPLPNEKPRKEKGLITSELTAALNMRKMTENTVSGQNHIPSTQEKRNIQKVLPVVKAKPISSVTRPHPPQISEIPPLLKTTTVCPSSVRGTHKQRAPTPPPSHRPEGLSTSIYYSNENEDWDYEDLPQYPIYSA
ncbi:PREDICTED: uncharacterized protein LOC106124174 [Papilio xuthus]|uniref:Uncharacterized protein LOC106124174 n=1 Tax=Papilio xuthus TaxID=66420 RepID=A0AAJ7EG52_PAPXU|nr:PREDICTED: uncharacterized protein LOC106124174 [Papilio xuthus]